MIERNEGSILVTSATAAVRGNPGQHSHAGAMGGRRMLCQVITQADILVVNSVPLSDFERRAEFQGRARVPPAGGWCS